MKRHGYGLTALMFAGLIMCFVSCGKKAPPVPPGIPPLPVVKGLDYSLDGAWLTLTWKALSGKGSENLSGYTVMRSVTGPHDEPCEGCPILFKRVRDLGPTATEYREQVIPGNSYIYKVVGYTEYKDQSPDSTLIRFTVPDEDKRDG